MLNSTRISIINMRICNVLLNFFVSVYSDCVNNFFYHQCIISYRIYSHFITSVVFFSFSYEMLYLII